MPKKKTPYISLGVLITALFFIIGFRAGQSVEKTNKETSILLSIPPSVTAAPTARPLSFATLAVKDCGMELLYPASLLPEGESSQTARLTDKSKTVFTLSCTAWNRLQPTSVPGIPAGSVGGRPLSMTRDDNETVGFQVRHPFRNILITVEVSKALYPFVLQNLSFVR